LRTIFYISESDDTVAGRTVMHVSLATVVNKNYR